MSALIFFPLLLLGSCSLHASVGTFAHLLNQTWICANFLVLISLPASLTANALQSPHKLMSYDFVANPRPFLPDKGTRTDAALIPFSTLVPRDDAIVERIRRGIRNLTQKEREENRVEKREIVTVISSCMPESSARMETFSLCLSRSQELSFRRVNLDSSVQSEGDKIS